MLIGAVRWSISDANWYSVLRNISNLMIGSMQADPEAINRVNIMTLVLAFGIGVSFRAWSRIGLRGWIGLAIISALLIGIPAFTSTLPLPTAIVTTGSIDVVSGSVTERPIPAIAFIGQAGETVTLRLATERVDSDEALAATAAFTDRAADALYSAANARLNGLRRLNTIEKELADPNLPANRRAVLISERDTLTTNTRTPITERYALAQGEMLVRILAADAQTVLAEATLTRQNPETSFTLPDTGWYILDKTVLAEQDANTLLEMRGIYPAIERSISRVRVDAEGKPVINPRTGQPQITSVVQHVRVTDDFILEAPIPKIDGVDAPRYLFVNNQYRGVRPLNDFLSIHFGPFFERMSRALLPCFLMVFIGYAVMEALDRVIKPVPPAPNWSRRFAFWMWVVMPVVIYLIISSTDPGAWGGLFLTFLLTAVGIVVSFPIGVLLALGRRAEGLPAVKYFCILVIEFVRGVPLITVLFLASLALPLVSPALREVPGAVRAMVAITIFSAAYLAENVRGGLQSISPGQIEAAKALGMNPIQITLLITLPQALRAVIPALVGQCISLFKDTSLVAIVGLADLTRVADAIVAQAEYIGLRRETYLFISIVYFVFSFAMAYVSRKIEESGSGAARQVRL